MVRDSPERFSVLGEVEYYAGYVQEHLRLGGAVLVADSDVAPDDPAEWRVVTQRQPDERESTSSHKDSLGGMMRSR